MRPWSQDSLTKRRKTKGIVSQIEGLYIFHNKLDTISSKRHLHYEGSTRGDVIAKVIVDPLEQCWRMKQSLKVDLLGKDAIKPCGGKVDFEDGEDDDDDGDAAEATSSPEELVPFAWMSYSFRFFENLMHMLVPECVLDFTPGDGNLALACITAGKPYVGFCHTENHVTGLYDLLTTKVLELMATEQSKLYNVQFVKTMSKPSGQKRPCPPATDGEPGDSGSEAAAAKKKGDKGGNKADSGKDKKGKKVSKKKKAKTGKGKKGKKGKKDDDDDDEASEGDVVESSEPPSPSQSAAE